MWKHVNALINIGICHIGYMNVYIPSSLKKMTLYKGTCIYLKIEYVLSIYLLMGEYMQDQTSYQPYPISLVTIYSTFTWQ